MLPHVPVDMLAHVRLTPRSDSHWAVTDLFVIMVRCVTSKEDGQIFMPF